jgi:hypothetical protein
MDPKGAKQRLGSIYLDQIRIQHGKNDAQKEKISCLEVLDCSPWKAGGFS